MRPGGWPLGQRPDVFEHGLTAVAEAGQIASAENYRPGRWHHVAAVREQNRVLLYIDGHLQAESKTAPDNDDFTYHLVIGRYSLADGWYGRPFAGHIDELAIYYRALSSNEISDHYRLVAR